MSDENFPLSENPEEGLQEKRKNSKNRNMLLGFLVVALLGTWGYLIYNNNHHRQETENLTAEIVIRDSAKNELQQELDDAALRLDALKTSNATADSLIQTKDKEIQNLKSRVQAIINNRNATKAQLDEARRLIAELKGNIDTYASEIASLKEENKQLTEKNAEVTAQRDEAQRNYDSANVALLQKDNIIDIGSTLHASNFKITGVKEKNNGKEKITRNAKKVDKLNIQFTLDENRITPTGSKELYISITAPDGKPVTVGALGSGTFRDRDGNERNFTKKVSVNYVQGQNQQINVEWSQEENFKSGDYQVEVYNNGFLIGKGSVNLKKGGLFGFIPYLPL